MRDWCRLMAVAACSAMLAYPGWAQQKEHEAGARDAANASAEKNGAPANDAAGSNSNLQNGIFALPTTPRPTPFPGPAGETKDRRPPGRLLPRYELAGMYDYINFQPGSPFNNFSNHGATGVHL